MRVWRLMILFFSIIFLYEFSKTTLEYNKLSDKTKKLKSVLPKSVNNHLQKEIIWIKNIDGTLTEKLKLGENIVIPKNGQKYISVKDLTINGDIVEVSEKQIKLHSVKLQKAVDLRNYKCQMQGKKSETFTLTMHYENDDIWVKGFKGSKISNYKIKGYILSAKLADRFAQGKVIKKGKNYIIEIQSRVNGIKDETVKYECF